MIDLYKFTTAYLRNFFTLDTEVVSPVSDAPRTTSTPAINGINATLITDMMPTGSGYATTSGNLPLVQEQVASIPPPIFVKSEIPQTAEKENSVVLSENLFDFDLTTAQTEKPQENPVAIAEQTTQPSVLPSESKAMEAPVSETPQTLPVLPEQEIVQPQTAVAVESAPVKSEESLPNENLPDLLQSQTPSEESVVTEQPVIQTIAPSVGQISPDIVKSTDDSIVQTSPSLPESVSPTTQEVADSNQDISHTPDVTTSILDAPISEEVEFSVKEVEVAPVKEDFWESLKGTNPFEPKYAQYSDLILTAYRFWGEYNLFETLNPDKYGDDTASNAIFYTQQAVVDEDLKMTRQREERVFWDDWAQDRREHYSQQEIKMREDSRLEDDKRRAENEEFRKSDEQRRERQSIEERCQLLEEFEKMRRLKRFI